MCAVVPLLAADVFGEMGLYDSAQEALIRSYSVEIKVCALFPIRYHCCRGGCHCIQETDHTGYPSIRGCAAYCLQYESQQQYQQNRSVCLAVVLYHALYLSYPCRRLLESDCCARGS